MLRILFVCHGNICRSPAAEMVFRAKADVYGLAAQADSAATTFEEIGADVYPPMRRALAAHGMPVTPHAARRTERADYARYDRIICMDEENRRDLLRLYGGDPEGKISLLMAWAGEHREVSDPWYTRDFEGALRDIEAGCDGLIHALMQGEA